MFAMARQFWNEDQGAIISVEWILFVAVLIFGLVVGLAALRNQAIAALATLANALNPGGPPLQANPIAPTTVMLEQVDPAP